MSGSRRPVRWRQAVVTFACVYPTSLLLSLVVPALTTGWPWPLSTALTAALLVAALTWVLLPLSGRLVGNWTTTTRQCPGPEPSPDPEP
jgi:uncharacterized protein